MNWNLDMEILIVRREATTDKLSDHKLGELLDGGISSTKWVY